MGGKSGNLVVRHGFRGKTRPRLTCPGGASSGLPEMHFSFVKQSLHPNRIVPTKKAAKHKFGIKTSSVHTSHKITPISSDDINAWCQRRRCTCRPTGPWGCGAGVQLRDRRLSCAARIIWVCRCSTGVAYNWSSAQCADRPPDRQQHTSDVGRCKSSLGSTCPVSPRHIPSQTHSPQLAARISAGFFSPPAAIAGAMLQAASWAMGVQISHVADGACDPVLGTVAGTTIRARLSGATVVCKGLWASA